MRGLLCSGGGGERAVRRRVVGGVGVWEHLRLGEMGREEGGGGGEGRGILLLAGVLGGWGGAAVLVGGMAEVRGGGRLWGGLGSHGGRGWRV